MILLLKVFNIKSRGNIFTENHRLCTKSRFVGGVSGADLAHIHTLASVASHNRGHRPLPQTFGANADSAGKMRNRLSLTRKKNGHFLKKCVMRGIRLTE